MFNFNLVFNKQQILDFLVKYPKAITVICVNKFKKRVVWIVWCSNLMFIAVEPRNLDFTEDCSSMIVQKVTAIVVLCVAVILLLLKLVRFLFVMTAKFPLPLTQHCEVELGITFVASSIYLSIARFGMNF
ncbi:hypothetical protein GQX74_014518 [Glossina fuscipes]|nr:hypothetical protein GQX74_014518 [Glossina fuscipes]